MAQVKKIDFMYEFAFNKKLPSFYDLVKVKRDSVPLLNSISNNHPVISDSIFLVYDVPSLLTVIKKESNSLQGFKSVIQHKGFCIDLNGYNDLESYLKDRFSKSSRQLLRSAKKRLEHCFNISCKMYFGKIDKNHYHYLFKRFYEMLELRAFEKGIDNRNLKQWDLYTERVYEMIFNKQASLFVIYDDKNAINISLNMHVKNAVFLFITSYDIDYSKFRLGHTNWMMQLDWFIKNDFKIIDFSKGNVGYKKRWTNVEYNFEYHIYYDKSKSSKKMQALYLANKYKFLQILRNKNINNHYYNFLRWLNGNNKKLNFPNYKLIEQTQIPLKINLKSILFRESDDYSFLKRIIYTYLYSLAEHVENVIVYQDINNTKNYYLQSKKEIFKIVIN